MISIRLSKMLALCFAFGANVIIVSLVFSLSQDVNSAITLSTNSLATASIYDDEFNGPDLNPNWYWYNEDPSRWSLTSSPGNLRINTTLGDLKNECGYTAKNVLLQQGPGGDFEAVIKMSFYPFSNYHQAGLFFFLDGLDTYVKLGTNWNDILREGQGIAFTYVENGEITSQRYWTDMDLSQPIILKLQKSDSSYNGYFSHDGQSFTQVNTIYTDVNTDPRFGLYSMHSCYTNPPEIPADFDYFRVTESCEVPFFWQRDPNGINDHPLRGTCGTNFDTLGEGGCTLTSATMLFRFYGANLTKDNTEMTPPNLSDCMGIKACPFDWWFEGVACSNRNATNPRRDKSFSYSQLDDELNKYNRPVILQMCQPKGSCDTDGPQTHWVLVTSGQGDDPANYTIWDPWFKCGQNMRLNSRSETWDFVGMTVYDGTPTCGFSTEVPTCALSISPVGLPSTSSMIIGENNPITPFGSMGTSDITGTATLYRATNVTMTVQLSAESNVGNVTEMLVWSDTLSNTTWQPFEPFVWLPLSDFVYAQFMDDMGNISDVVSDTPNPSGPPAAEDPNRTFLPLTTK